MNSLAHILESYIAHLIASVILNIRTDISFMTCFSTKVTALRSVAFLDHMFFILTVKAE